MRTATLTSCVGRARLLGAGLLAAVALSGCGILPGTGSRDPEWALDEEAERYYRPGVLLQGPELLEEHFPAIADASPRALADGRFTDPDAREWIPAPDDHWWQAVVQLDPEQAQELRSRAEPSDGGAGGHGGTVPEDEVLALLVPTLEGELEPCSGEWVSVIPALTGQGHGNVSEGGDIIELAVLCSSSDQLVTSSLDM